MTPENRSTNAHRFKCGVLPVIAALFLSACNSGNDQPIIVLPGGNSATTSEPTDVGMDPVDEPVGGMDPVDEPVEEMDPVDEPVEEMDPEEQTPSLDGPSASLDPEGDDRPGLVVTGLNGTPAEDVSSVWHVNIQLFRVDSLTPGSGDAGVSLLRYDPPITINEHIDFYVPELDLCEIRDLNETGGSSGGSSTSPRVNGGSTVTINSQSGPLVELPYDEDTRRYSVNNLVPGALPPDATLSIPGDQFPNVAAYPLVEPVVPVKLTPATGVLSDDEVSAPFTWEALPNKPGGYFQISFLAYREDGTFAGFPIFCRVIDDGEFNMPEAVVEAFATYTDLRVEARFARTVQRFDIINDIAFRQLSTVAE
ncbi:MAG: hypothetical protein AB8B64_26480 [Granulosicoccus sp.]